MGHDVVDAAIDRRASDVIRQVFEYLSGDIHLLVAIGFGRIGHDVTTRIGP